MKDDSIFAPIHVGLLEGRKFKRLCRTFPDVPEEHVLGMLTAFWLRTLRQVRCEPDLVDEKGAILSKGLDGILACWDGGDVEDAAGWRGIPGAFAEALIGVGFLCRVKDGEHAGHLAIHEFDLYAGAGLRARSEARSKKSVERTIDELLREAELAMRASDFEAVVKACAAIRATGKPSQRKFDRERAASMESQARAMLSATVSPGRQGDVTGTSLSEKGTDENVTALTGPGPGPETKDPNLSVVQGSAEGDASAAPPPPSPPNDNPPKTKRAGRRAKREAPSHDSVAGLLSDVHGPSGLTYREHFAATFEWLTTQRIEDEAAAWWSHESRTKHVDLPAALRTWLRRANEDAKLDKLREDKLRGQVLPANGSEARDVPAWERRAAEDWRRLKEQADLQGKTYPARAVFVEKHRQRYESGARGLWDEYIAKRESDARADDRRAAIHVVHDDPRPDPTVHRDDAGPVAGPPPELRALQDRLAGRTSHATPSGAGPKRIALTPSAGAVLATWTAPTGPADPEPRATAGPEEGTADEPPHTDGGHT